MQAVIERYPSMLGNSERVNSLAADRLDLFLPTIRFQSRWIEDLARLPLNMLGIPTRKNDGRDHFEGSIADGDRLQHRKHYREINCLLLPLNAIVLQ